MLCRRIEDAVESDEGGADGLDLLDTDIVFAPDKTLRRHDAPLHGYEIHHGQVSRSVDDDWLGVGFRRGEVYGTHWHGLFDNDEVRRRWLADTAAAAGRHGFAIADDVDVTARRDAQLDLMADLLAAHAHIDVILRLLETGSPERPTIVSTLRR